MLTAPSSNVVPFRQPAPEATRPPFGRVFCGDWLHSVSATVTSAEHHVLFMLTRFANGGTGKTKVSAEAIGEECNLTKQYVQDTLRSLVEKGLITREGGGKGPGNAAVYSLQADPQDVADFHDDLLDRRAERRAAWKPNIGRLVDRLISDVGLDVAREFRDAFEGDDAAAEAVLFKTATWSKKARIAYIEEILARRHAL